jgi:hypothetical protein
MFETLMNLVQQNAGSAIVNNPAIPNQHNNTAMESVVQSMMQGLGSQAQGGGLGNLLGMVVNGGQNIQDNPVTAGVQQNVEQGLMEKLGISPQVAMSVAGALVPVVLGKLMNKAADPNDSSVDGNTILGAATGQQGIDWMGMAGSAMADGKLDMNDLMRVAASQMGGGGGGLGGMLGGLLGGR